MSEGAARRVLTADDAFALAGNLMASGKSAEAEAFYRALIARGSLGSVINLAVLLRTSGRLSEAIEVCREGLRLSPGEPRISWHLAFALLEAGEYEEGFRLYEHRTNRIQFDQLREWRGGPIRSLLLLPEQGFGDQIQFARYIPVLQSRGIDVHLKCDAPVSRLFEPLGAHAPAVEAWAPLGSLPHLLGTTLATIPPPAPLRGNAIRRGGIGFMGRGNPQHYNDANRSLPDDIAADLQASLGAINLRPEDTGCTDFQDTADLIAGLDFVVTVDTSIAHLSGSLGVPTYLLLPFAADWRWLRDRSDSPWYPSIRIFRQPSPGDWASVVAEIERAIPPRS